MIGSLMCLVFSSTERRQKKKPPQTVAPFVATSMGVLNRVNQVLMKADVMVLAATSCIDFGCMLAGKPIHNSEEVSIAFAG
ncbi:unnamed protein product [Ixodes persulcatus]